MKIRDEVVKKADIIADALNKGKDVEIRKHKDGISVAAITKRVIKDDPDGWETVSK